MRARVAVVCDLVEENWPSMELVGDMLLRHLRRHHPREVEAEMVRPPMRCRFTRAGGEAAGAAFNVDRLLNRMVDYPAFLRRQRERFDLFHVVDHSYAQLVHAVPPERTVVTCHDLDTFRSVLAPQEDPRPWPFRAMTRRILSGMQKAARITCDSSVIRDELLEYGLVPPERVVVVPLGTHPECTPLPVPHADRATDQWLGPEREDAVDLLHVGSTAPRKRLDVLVKVFAEVRAAVPRARLIRVGGGLSPEATRLAEELGVADAIVSLPFLTRELLAAVYRRAALVLQPSDREGFGLPVAEAQACGAVVVASDLGVLRETGGNVPVYCPPGDVPAWTAAALALLTERDQQPEAWLRRRQRSVAAAAPFRWEAAVRQLVGIYQDVLER